MMFFSFLVLFSLFSSIFPEAIRQCHCKKYDKCLKSSRAEPMGKCFAKCSSILPSSSFVQCIQQFSNDFERLTQCSYSHQNGINGCTSRKKYTVKRRHMGEFRDLLIHSFEKSLNLNDLNRHFINDGAAQQAACVFECLYPGRNSCTKKLKCDIYLPSEEDFFNDFYDCAVKRNIYSKAEKIYSCISQLFVRDDVSFSNAAPLRSKAI